ncbi:uncharacterized protein LOC120446909 isoform X3 [Drosophila santomea]|uniref:uncharacterized protein LOC120446909 isoform X3 n=1 Tax=Drosophila santomea TaxID=129105 RepID=UPI001954639B|nr:uncharacterized protein LOC120446909 isoform X3 [Drosophila santomea]
MSKKMWQKIFKSKSQKPQPLAKINKRHSRIAYEEYQQLNDLLAGEKGQLSSFSNEKENEHENGNGNGGGSSSINVFEQQPLQGSFNSLQFSEAQQQQQQQQQQQKSQQHQLSTFSRVRNTFSMKRNSSSSSKKQGNAKPSESDAADAATAAATVATATAAAATSATLATLTNNSPGNQLQRVLIVVNKIDVATNCPTNHLHANPTETAPPNAAIKSTTSSTTDPQTEDSRRAGGDEDDTPAPPPLTSGSPLPVPEYVPEQATQLTPCPCCSRTFGVNALRKHVVICEKASKKRKVFDSSRQRRDGTALSTYVLPKNFGLPNAERTAGIPSPPTTSREATSVNAAPEPVNSPQPVPRKSQTEMVRSTARASMRKAASTLSANSAPEAPAVAPAAPAVPAGPAAPAAPLVRERSLAKRIKAPACDRCPHCERSFNPKAFDRHVEWCKEKAIQATMKSTNSQETSKAKERLEARKQYRPPNLKTKRSLARDKYSGNHEDLLDAGEITVPKPNLMSLSMTSSVHSDNTQAQVFRSRASEKAGGRAKPNSTVTHNQVNLYMANNEDPPSSPTPRERAELRRSKRTQRESCSEIDDTMERLRRNASGDALQLAKLDCVEAPVLQPARRRKKGPKTDKVDAVEKQIPCLPQVTMTFDELNGLIKRKGGTPICNVEMDEQGIGSLVSKHPSSTSLVRQARRRIRTKENPDLELRALQSPCSVITKDIQYASLNSSLVPMQRKLPKEYSGSEEDSPRPEIQIKLEAAAMRTVCRSTKRSGRSSQAMGNAEPMRALPMSDLKENFETINQSMGQTVLPRLQLGSERQDYEPEDDEVDNYTSDQEEDPEDVDFMAKAVKLLERVRSSSSPVPNPDLVDTHSEYDEEQPEAEPEFKLPPLMEQNSNVSRRLLLEDDENSTMYFKSAPRAKRRSNRSDTKMPEDKLQRQQSNASSASSQEEKSRLELEKRPVDEDQKKREIFISIETEANAQGRSPISPDSLRHMVGNAHTPIEVLHIENGNEPEHARFSKISDTEDAEDEPRDRASQSTNRLAPSSNGSSLAPNVQLNNAKNMIQKMHSDFRQMGEEASASMRRQLIGSNAGRGEEHQRSSSVLPASNPPHQVEANSPMTPSPSADSDELSSLDGYPMSSSQGSRRGASSKLSSDSAYGSNSPYSLSRQCSSQLQTGTPRSQALMRPHTASAKLSSCMIDASTQAHTEYGTLKARQRLFAPECGNNNGDGGESSSSGSEHSFAAHPKQQQSINYSYQQPLQQEQQQQQQMQQMQMQQMNCNYNYQQEQQQLHQQQQQQQQAQIPAPTAYNTNNNNVPMTPTTSEQSLMSNSSMSSSKKSNYCYECGSKFIFETAKFCMDCGLRRAEL